MTLHRMTEHVVLSVNIYLVEEYILEIEHQSKLLNGRLGIYEDKINEFQNQSIGNILAEAKKSNLATSPTF